MEPVWRDVVVHGRRLQRAVGLLALSLVATGVLAPPAAAGAGVWELVDEGRPAAQMESFPGQYDDPSIRRNGGSGTREFTTNASTPPGTWEVQWAWEAPPDPLIPGQAPQLDVRLTHDEIFYSGGYSSRFSVRLEIYNVDEDGALDTLSLPDFPVFPAMDASCAATGDPTLSDCSVTPLESTGYTTIDLGQGQEGQIKLVRWVVHNCGTQCAYDFTYVYTENPSPDPGPDPGPDPSPGGTSDAWRPAFPTEIARTAGTFRVGNAVNDAGYGSVRVEPVRDKMVVFVDGGVCQPDGTALAVITGVISGGSPAILNAEWRASERYVNGECVPNDPDDAITIRVEGRLQPELHIRDADSGDTYLTTRQAVSVYDIILSGDGTQRRAARADLLVDTVLTGALGPRGPFAGGAGTTLYLGTAAQFPDGLALAGVAGATNGVTLLIDPNSQIFNQAIYDSLPFTPSQVVVAGGTAAIPDDVLPDTGVGGPLMTRVAGTNRFDTAAKLSARTFSPGAPVVYVATGANYPDALSGGAEAARRGAPVLLVDGGRMPAETDAELRRLAPARIVVLGGGAVIPDAVLAELGDYAPQVDRVSGPTRLETAVEVSQASSGAPTGLVMAAPGDDFVDALVLASLAWLVDGPLLLTQTDQQPAVVLDELQRLGATNVLFLGPREALGAEARAQIARHLG